jgi:hypothetical protein
MLGKFSESEVCSSRSSCIRSRALSTKPTCCMILARDRANFSSNDSDGLSSFMRFDGGCSMVGTDASHALAMSLICRVCVEW